MSVMLDISGWVDWRRLLGFGGGVRSTEWHFSLAYCVCGRNCVQRLPTASSFCSSSDSGIITRFRAHLSCSSCFHLVTPRLLTATPCSTAWPIHQFWRLQPPEWSRDLVALWLWPVRIKNRKPFSMTIVWSSWRYCYRLQRVNSVHDKLQTPISRDVIIIASFLKF